MTKSERLSALKSPANHLSPKLPKSGAQIAAVPKSEPDDKIVYHFWVPRRIFFTKAKSERLSALKSPTNHLSPKLPKSASQIAAAPNSVPVEGKTYQRCAAEETFRTKAKSSLPSPVKSPTNQESPKLPKSASQIAAAPKLVPVDNLTYQRWVEMETFLTKAKSSLPSPEKSPTNQKSWEVFAEFDQTGAAPERADAKVPAWNVCRIPARTNFKHLSKYKYSIAKTTTKSKKMMVNFEKRFVLLSLDFIDSIIK